LASIEYHWVDYDAEANWNLRQDFAHPISFTHDADGAGIKASLGWEERLFTAWTITLKMDYLDWTTNPGSDLIFMNDGSVGTAQLNRVNWRSHAFSLGLQHRFE